MIRKSISNLLELAYSPMSNYDFTVLRDDPIVQQALEHSSLYIIAQRSELWFDNVTIDEYNNKLVFEIRQHNNPNFLTCYIPVFQKSITIDETETLIFEFGSNERDKVFNQLPAMGVQGIKIYRNGEPEPHFLIWFSPEKFLQNYWVKCIEAEVIGDIRSFTRYKVHYVGQATKQEIWKRLTGHSTLQDILSLEIPYKYGSLPTNEIALLLFTFQDNLEIRIYDPESSIEGFMNATAPDRRAIFLDAEKALIKSIQPAYNDELFKNYPKSTDGLYNLKYDAITYSLIDPITLVYDKGEIEGGLSHMGGDFIFIKDNATMELIKYEDVINIKGEQI